MSILDENAARDPNSGLGVTNEMKRSWMAISKWALFFAVIGFIYVALSLLMLGSIGTMLDMMRAISGDNPVLDAMGPLMSYVTIISGLLMVVIFFVNFYHLRFATQIQRAVNFSDQSAFEKAWLNLRNHFRLYGIATCVMIAFYLILLILIGTVLSNTVMPAG